MSIAVLPGITQVVGGKGTPIAVQQVPSFDLSSLSTPGEIIANETFDSPVLGPWDDGVVGASRDCQMWFNGHPTCRLDPQGSVTSGTTTPGGSPLTTGVVFKRRFQWPVDAGGIFSVEMWVRWSSVNLTTNTYTTISLYNRDGTNAYMSRVWLDPTQDPMALSHLTTQVSSPFYKYQADGTVDSFTATHMYELSDPAGAHLDKTGMWTFVRLITDFYQMKYVGYQVNNVWFATSDPIYIFSSGGARALHFSIEVAQKNSLRPRFWNIAQMVCRRWA